MDRPVHVSMVRIAGDSGHHFLQYDYLSEQPLKAQIVYDSLILACDEEGRTIRLAGVF